MLKSPVLLDAGKEEMLDFWDVLMTPHSCVSPWIPPGCSSRQWRETFLGRIHSRLSGMVKEVLSGPAKFSHCPSQPSQAANWALLEYQEVEAWKGAVKSKRSWRRVLGMEARLETVRGVQSTNSVGRRMVVCES